MKETSDLLNDILDAINTIESFGIKDYTSFLEDEITQDAVMYNLIILGEAANNLNEDFRSLHDEIPWSSMIGTRNIIVHGYDQIKLQIVWDILDRDLPELKEKIQKFAGSATFE